MRFRQWSCSIILADDTTVMLGLVSTRYDRGRAVSSDLVLQKWVPWSEVESAMAHLIRRACRESYDELRKRADRSEGSAQPVRSPGGDMGGSVSGHR